MKKPLRVLIVEDSEDDALLILRELRKGGYEPIHERVETAEDMQTALRDREWDVVLSDYKMPRFSAPRALECVQSIGQALPFIVISGTVGEDVAVEVMKAGAHDFFVKGSLIRLVSAIQREMREAENQRQRRTAEREREAAMERSSHLNAVLWSIRDVNRLIVREKERKPLIKAVAGSLVRTRGFHGAWIVLTDRLPGEVLSANAGFSDDALSRLTAWVEAGRFPSCWDRARAGNDVVAVPNPRAECGDCPLAHAYHGGSSLTAVLAHGGERFGCMGVSLPPQFASDEEERSLLSDIAGDIGFALSGMEAEAARRKSEETLRAIFQSASDGILLADAELWRFVVGNDAICRMLGYSHEEIQGLSVADIHPAEHLDYVRAQFERQARGEITLATDIPIKRKDGTVFFADVNSAMLELDGRRHLVGAFHDITERKQAEESLRRFERAVENASDAIGMSTPDGKHYYQNKVFDDLFGEIGDDPPVALYLDEAVGREVFATIMSGRSWTGEVRMRGKAGNIIDILLRAYSMKDEQGAIIGLVGMHTNITDLRIMEAQLIQAQKMEAVGRLAGGVAHDYNNTLTVIIGNAQMAMRNESADDSLRDDMKEILDAAKRSRDLTRQLLAFARKEIIAPEVLDLNATVETMLKILQKLIGEDIDLAWHPGKGLGPVLMDPSQLDQILANLCVNARDAITDVGKITIETDAAVIDADYCSRHAEGIPGDFILVAVSDDGSGMDRETMDNIFEPFFTTKGREKGTGLGLSTVYGIVKQNNGFINVYSEPGQGTTFRVYLPRHAGGLAEERPRADEQMLQGKGETVLVVEDDPSILKLVKRILTEFKYDVLLARTPREALKLAKAHSGEVALLLTDVVMPEMNGRELAEHLKALCPEIKCLYMSGYTANVIADRGVLHGDIQLIQKPFTNEGLATKVRHALDATGRATG